MNVALHPQRLDFISLCTGGGGLDLGIELACPAARAICLVEREAFAIAHLVEAMRQGLLAPAPVWSDVRTFPGRSFRGLVDGVIGGIPCQPHSLAGKRLGEDDERDLWSDARRIIVQCRPWIVVIENVEGMLSSGGAERVVRDLRRLRFTVEIGLFSASEAGASHQRNRVFIVAVSEWRSAMANSDREGWRHKLALTGSEQSRESGPSRGVQSRRLGCEVCGELADADITRLEGYRQSGKCSGELPAGPCSASDDQRLGLFPPGPSDLDGWRRVLTHSPHLEPAVRRMADGVAARLDLSGPHAARIERLRLLGNGVVSLEAAYAFRALCTRLAASGSPSAAELVRMMEQT